MSGVSDAAGSCEWPAVAPRELGIAAATQGCKRPGLFDLLEIPNLNNHRSLSKVRKIRSFDAPVTGSSR
jgi:hypothetical protein